MKSKISKERKKLVTQIENFTETPLIILGFAWLALLIIELLNQSNAYLQNIGLIIWIIFIVDFILKFFLSPAKIKYLKKNILVIISLIIPAFRLFRLIRIFRILRLSRGLNLVKIIGSINRGMRALSRTMTRRAVGYVMALSIIVLFAGSAGLFSFEKNVNPGFSSYGNSLWWTAMLIISMGTENWPKTTEGRILTFMIAVYGFAVFGYVTATIATFFIGRDEEKNKKIAIRNKTKKKVFKGKV